MRLACYFSKKLTKSLSPGLPILFMLSGVVLSSSHNNSVSEKVMIFMTLL
jgi:hypothetical protein